MCNSWLLGGSPKWAGEWNEMVSLLDHLPQIGSRQCMDKLSVIRL